MYVLTLNVSLFSRKYLYFGGGRGIGGNRILVTLKHKMILEWCSWHVSISKRKTWHVNVKEGVYVSLICLCVLFHFVCFPYLVILQLIYFHLGIFVSILKRFRAETVVQLIRKEERCRSLASPFFLKLKLHVCLFFWNSSVSHLKVKAECMRETRHTQAGKKKSRRMSRTSGRRISQYLW